MNIIRVRLAVNIGMIGCGAAQKALHLSYGYWQVTLHAYSTRISVLYRNMYGLQYYVCTTWCKEVPIDETFWGDVE